MADMTKLDLDVVAVTPGIGAEVRGLDCGGELDADTVAELRRAWLDHLVLFFPDQDLDREQQIAFASRFGDLTEGHPVEPLLDEDERVQPIDSVKDRTNFWHTDLTFLSAPPAGSMLRAVSLPDVGGDTMWANTRDAFDGLAPPLQELCEQLHAVHYAEDYMRIVAKGGGNSWNGQPLERLEPVVHPVVRVHPETGRRNLFVNPGFTRRIVELPGGQGQDLLRLLYKHMTQPQYIVRYRWRAGSIAFWDNRTTMHFGVYDYGEDRRVMHRVVLAGDEPKG
jgi:alpha-ketoglutarate-dependent taurine dioxygenase